MKIVGGDEIPLRLIISFILIRMQLSVLVKLNGIMISPWIPPGVRQFAGCHFRTQGWVLKRNSGMELIIVFWLLFKMDINYSLIPYILPSRSAKNTQLFQTTGEAVKPYANTSGLSAMLTCHSIPPSRRLIA